MRQSRQAHPSPPGPDDTGTEDAWHVPTSLALRTWRVPAAGATTTPRGSGACRYPTQLRPRLRDRDSWEVPIVTDPVGDDTTRARPVLRRTPPEVDDTWPDVEDPGVVADEADVTELVEEPDVADDVAEEADVAEPLVQPDDDTWPGDDTRQRRFVGLADAMTRQFVGGEDHDELDDDELDDDELDDDELDDDDTVYEPEDVDDTDEPYVLDDGDELGAVDAIEVVADPDLDDVPRLDHIREEGGRAAFLGEVGRHIPAASLQAARPVDPVPEPEFLNLAGDDLLGSFARAVAEAGGTCHRVVGDVPETLLDRLVAELDTWEAVVSADADAAELAERFANRGVEVAEATPDAAARASLGITSAVAGIAATGSLVLDSHRDRGRLVAVLPRVLVCVLAADRVVAAPADVLRALGARPAGLPSSLVLVTGPSRTGDIEQLLTIGAHGPTALHVILVEPEPD